MEIEKTDLTQSSSIAPPSKPKALSLYSHTFEDVVSSSQMKKHRVTVSLPYPYLSVDPKATCFFFQGQALIIDPKISLFDSYVTSPLLPCLFGRIFDSETGRSLVFHKDVTHSMDSLLPFIKEFSPSKPENLSAILFTGEMQIQTYKENYGSSDKGNSQIREMNAVRNFLVERVLIPKDKVERRFLRSHQINKLPDMGQYEFTEITVGVTKAGVVFTTSLYDKDMFGIEGRLTTRELREAYDELDMIGLTHLRQEVMWHIGSTRRSQSELSKKPLSIPFFDSVQLHTPMSTLAKIYDLQFEGHVLRVKTPFEKHYL